MIPAIKSELKKAVIPAIKLELKKEKLEAKASNFLHYYVGLQINLADYIITSEVITLSQKLKIVRVNTEYCEYLRQFDYRVLYNKNEKENRPFVGILFEINSCEYFAPLSSPKPKHKNMKNTIDFFKIKGGELGAVNFNNMIPVMAGDYSLVDLNKETLTLAELKYQKLLREQIYWLNNNYIQVKNKSLKLYNFYNDGKLPESIKIRCCNFKFLEEKCLEYKRV